MTVLAIPAVTVATVGRHRATVERPARKATAKPAHRHAAKPTFTPWRILFLFLLFPATIVAVAGALYLSPEGRQLFNGTVPSTPGQPVIVTVRLVPGPIRW